MERVGVLINKLQEQLLQKADVNNMLVIAQLLHSELLFNANKASANSSNENKKVSVVAPHAIVVSPEHQDTNAELYKPVPAPVTDPEPVAEPMPEPELPVPDPAPLPVPRPEPEPIPHFVEQKSWYSPFPPKEETPSPWPVDSVLDIPTLAHQEKVVYELNDTMQQEGGSASVNDKLKTNTAEMSSMLQDAPIRDLKKAISINDRHRFIRELFRDDETMYERSIKTINSFHIFAEAEYWIQRELKVKLGWDTTLELVKVFDQLVKRRFS